LVPALAEGRVDAVCGWEPYLSEARKALGRARQVSFLSDIYMEVSALAGREGLENPHGRHLERLMRALVRAEQFVNEHEMRALEIVDRYLTNRDRRTVRDYWQVSEFKVRLDNV